MVVFTVRARFLFLDFSAHGGQAVRWSNNSQVYDRVGLAQDPEHRVNIDTAARLLIHDLRVTDSSLYTCHVYGKLHGSIKLKVTFLMQIQ